MSFGTNERGAIEQAPQLPKLLSLTLQRRKQFPHLRTPLIQQVSPEDFGHIKI